MTMIMKKKLYFISALFILINLTLVSCYYGVRGNGKVVKSERSAGQFEAIEVSAGLDVFLSQDSVNKIVVEADENLQGIIKTEVSNGRLKIYPDKGIRHASSKKVYVTLKSINKLHASSGSDVKSKELKLHDVDISVSSGANLEMTLIANKIVLEGNSGGRIAISGTTENLDVDGSSGVNIKAENLQSHNCIAGASSGANLKINVTEKINAKASSGGQIRVSGEPKERNIEKSSGGDVRFN